MLSGEKVSGLDTRDDQLVVKTSSPREILVDGVVAGIGIQPNVELAQAASLKVENGVVVDEFLRTSHPDSGELRRLIEEDGLRGMTSNPSIFQKAIVASQNYEEDIRAMTFEGQSPKAIYETLSQRDVQGAADEFRSVYDKMDARDGYVSLAVNPHLAHDTKVSNLQGDLPE